MGIWIFHRCNSKRGSFFCIWTRALYYVRWEKVCAYAYIYKRRKIPYSIFPACFSSRARVCSSSSSSTQRLHFSPSIYQMETCGILPGKQPVSQPARHTVQMYGENSSSQAHIYIYILLRALLYMYIYTCARLCVYVSTQKPTVLPALPLLLLMLN